jgi:hypothetical protein
MPNEVVFNSPELADEFEQDASLDKYNLDTDWEEQPKLFKKWSDRWAYAQAASDLSKEAVEQKMSELDAEIRDPLTWGEFFPDKKMTEAGIINWIKGNEEYQQAVRDRIEAQKIANLRKGDMMAMSQKKDAIEGLTQLHGQQYFSKPYIPQAVKEESETQTREALTTQLNTTRRRRNPIPQGQS